MSDNYCIEWIVTVSLLIAFVIHFWPIPWVDVIEVAVKAAIAIFIMLALGLLKG